MIRSHQFRLLRHRERMTLPEGKVIGIIAFIIVGALGGAIAKALMPGDSVGTSSAYAEL